MEKSFKMSLISEEIKVLEWLTAVQNIPELSVGSVDGLLTVIISY